MSLTLDVTTSNSIQDILVFDLRVQLQHCTYQRKNLLFALINVSTFICKREISGLSSPLINLREKPTWRMFSRGSSILDCVLNSPAGVRYDRKCPVGLSHRLSVSLRAVFAFDQRGERILGAVNVVLGSSSAVCKKIVEKYIAFYFGNSSWFGVRRTFVREPM